MGDRSFKFSGDNGKDIESESADTDRCCLNDEFSLKRFRMDTPLLAAGALIGEEESYAYYRRALETREHIAYLVYDNRKFIGAGGVSDRFATLGMFDEANYVETIRGYSG